MYNRKKKNGKGEVKCKRGKIREGKGKDLEISKEKGEKKQGDKEKEGKDKSKERASRRDEERRKERKDAASFPFADISQPESVGSGPVNTQYPCHTIPPSTPLTHTMADNDL